MHVAFKSTHFCILKIPVWSETSYLSLNPYLSERWDKKCQAREMHSWPGRKKRGEKPHSQSAKSYFHPACNVWFPVKADFCILNMHIFLRFSSFEARDLVKTAIIATGNKNSTVLSAVIQIHQISIRVMILLLVTFTAILCKTKCMWPIL